MTETTALLTKVATHVHNVHTFSAETITQLCDDLGDSVATEFKKIGHVLHGVQVHGYQCLISLDIDSIHHAFYITFSKFGGFEFTINQPVLSRIFNRRKALLAFASAEKILNIQIDLYNSYIEKLHRQSLKSLTEAIRRKTYSH